MDIVQQCLLIAPVPCLAIDFSALKFIWSSIQQVLVSKWQLEALAQLIAEILQTLNKEYRAGHLHEGQASMPLEYLNRFMGFTMLWTSHTVY